MASVLQGEAAASGTRTTRRFCIMSRPGLERFRPVPRPFASQSRHIHLRWDCPTISRAIESFEHGGTETVEDVRQGRFWRRDLPAE